MEKFNATHHCRDDSRTRRARANFGARHLFLFPNSPNAMHSEEAIAMPDPKTLRVGDRIRILRVPESDLRQRENEIATGSEMAGWTAGSIERIIAQSPVVRISQIDDDGCVWYDASIVGPDGTEEEHYLIVYDDDSWELANQVALVASTSAES